MRFLTLILSLLWLTTQGQTLNQPKKKFIFMGYCIPEIRTVPADTLAILTMYKNLFVPDTAAILAKCRKDTIKIDVPYFVTADTGRILSMYCDTITEPVDADTLYRGLYLNGFKNIVGNKMYEDALCYDLKFWKINAVHEYNLGDILGTSKEPALAKLHIRMRKESGIKEIVAARGNSASCVGAATTFNKNNADSADFDGWNLEFEPWNAYPTSTGGYTFDKTKASETSSTEASRGLAWLDNKRYLSEMKAGKSNGQVETIYDYFGWFKTPFEIDAPKTLIAQTDVLIVHMYYSSPDFGRSRTRCNDLNREAKAQNEIPIFRPILSAEPDFMQGYYKAHSLDEAYFEWKKGFDAMNYSNLKTDGYIVFALDFLRVAQPSSVPMARMIDGVEVEYLPAFADPDFINETLPSHLEMAQELE
jgi:hypothetical protein